MLRKTAFIKVSGDICSKNTVLEWIGQLVKEYFVVICVGGGTQINEAFAQQGFALGEYGPLGREIKTFKERQIARDVLERNQVKVQDLLAAKSIVATVIIPVLNIGSVLCHINGDIFVLITYLGYDKIYVLTPKDREEKKRKELNQYPKIEVVGF